MQTLNTALKGTRARLRPAAAAPRIAAQSRPGLQSLALYFFCFAAAGWLWEVLVDLLRVGHFVNRGMLYGPWLPIYGICGVLIVGLLSPLRLSGPGLFLTSAALCGAAEYLASWLIEAATGARWWDYSGMPGALHGRIFPLGLVLFGLAGWAGVRFLGPALQRGFFRLSAPTRRLLCGSLVVLFLADLGAMLVQPNTAAMV